MATNARELINQLRENGYSDKQIASKLGSNRDARYIGLIREGKRSGESYVSGLSNMLKGEENTTVPRRTRKSGEEARVRRSSTEYDDKGRITNKTTKSPNGKQVQDLLDKAENEHALIGVVAHFGKYKAYHDETAAFRSVPIWSKGYSAYNIKNRMREEGKTFEELVKEDIQKAYNPELADKLTRIDINVNY